MVDDEPTLGAKEAASGSAAGGISLPSGNTLGEEDAFGVTRSNPTTVVVLAGPQGSGKTTLITSIYESFLEAPFGGYLFAGSQTLVALERICHEGRVHSGRETAFTARTSMGEGVQFVHFSVVESPESSAQDLLISDISGELFESFRDSSSACKRATFLRRADVLCLFVDGALVADPSKRHVAKSDTRLLLRSLMDAGILHPTCRVQVVFAKWDLVLHAEEHEALVHFASGISETMRAEFSLPEPAFYEVAARPKRPAPPFAHGVPTLMRSWIAPARNVVQPALYVPNLRGAKREMDRFASLIGTRTPFQNEYDVRHV